MKKILILTKITTLIMAGLGFYQAFPKKLTKSFWNPTSISGRAYILDEKYGKGSKQIKNNQKYIKNHDEAVVFWVGGPKLGKNWDKDIKDYAFMFGKSKNSKDLAKNKVKGNYNISFDVYMGVQSFWEGIQSNKYFTDQFKASNTTGFINANSQRPLTIKDVQYMKNAPSIPEVGNAVFGTMMNDTTENMFQLAKDLKALGYKKVHYVSHSYGTFLMYEYLKRYQDKAFDNIDSVQMIATRLKISPELAGVIDGTFFPYMGYNKKTKKYEKIVKAPINQNAITTRIAMPIFWATAKQDYLTPLKTLDKSNKDKIKIISTDYDFRLGSMQPYELKIIDDGIDVKIIPYQTLIDYSQSYLLQKNKKFPDKPKVSVFKKGHNHHDYLLRWYLDNHILKTKGSNWLKKEPMIISDETYWCSLKKYSDNKELDDICVDKNKPDQIVKSS